MEKCLYPIPLLLGNLFCPRRSSYKLIRLIHELLKRDIDRTKREGGGLSFSLPLHRDRHLSEVKHNKSGIIPILAEGSFKNFYIDPGKQIRDLI